MTIKGLQSKYAKKVEEFDLIRIKRKSLNKDFGKTNGMLLKQILEIVDDLNSLEESNNTNILIKFMYYYNENKDSEVITKEMIDRFIKQKI